MTRISGCKFVFVEIGEWILSAYSRGFQHVRFPSERLGTRRISIAMRDFDDFLVSLELMDLPLKGGSFTWSNSHTPSSMSRTDRFLVSSEWEESTLVICIKCFCLGLCLIISPPYMM